MIINLKNECLSTLLIRAELGRQRDSTVLSAVSALMASPSGPSYPRRTRRELTERTRVHVPDRGGLSHKAADVEACIMAGEYIATIAPFMPLSHFETRELGPCRAGWASHDRPPPSRQIGTTRLRDTNGGTCEYPQQPRTTNRGYEYAHARVMTVVHAAAAVVTHYLRFTRRSAWQSSEAVAVG